MCARAACPVHLVWGLARQRAQRDLPCPRPAARAGDWADLQERGAGAGAAGEARPWGTTIRCLAPCPGVAASASSSVVPVVPRAQPAARAVPVVPTSSRNPPHASQATLGDKQLEGSHPHSYMRRFMSQLSMTQKEFTWGEALTLALLPQVGGWAGPAGMSPVPRGGCIVRPRCWCTHGKLGQRNC